MNFSTNSWANHKKGEATRQKILEAIDEKDMQSIAEISTYINRCEKQTRRQINALIREGKLTRQNGKLILSEKITYMVS